MTTTKQQKVVATKKPGAAKRTKKVSENVRAIAQDHLVSSVIPPLFVSVDTAAEALCVGRSVMYRLINQELVTTVRVGRLRLVPVRALEEYVQRLMDGAVTGGSKRGGQQEGAGHANQTRA